MAHTTTSQFPKLDRVIHNQRRLKRVNGLVTTLFVVCGAASLSTLSGCASDDVEEHAAALNRTEVEATIESFGAPGPRHSRLAELRAEAQRAMPDADFVIADIVATPAHTTAIIEVSGTLRADYMGVRATGDHASFRLEVVTTHAADGEIVSYRAHLTRAAVARAAIE